jgi:hypothetical protein
VIASRQQTCPWRASDPAPTAERDDDQRSRRRGIDRFAEDVHEHRQRQDRAAAADSTDDQPDRDTEGDR